jgi:hypothetical protein
MRRIEVILGELERLTRGLNLADLEQETAFTAEAIGFNLGLRATRSAKTSISYGTTAWRLRAEDAWCSLAPPGNGNAAGAQTE